MARTRKTVDDWLQDENRDKIRGWLVDGCTRAQLAKNMGIGKVTLYRWAEENDTFGTLLKTCTDSLVESIESDLYRCCHEGNVAAIIFALKNLKANKWKDKVEQSTKIEIEDTSSLSMMLKLDECEEDANE